ncbi:MAG: hypothetical protein ACOZQL_24425 [Myxococcota bacterium]
MVLNAAGLSLPLVSSPNGPFVSEDDPRTQVLAWALATIVTNPAFVDALRNNQSIEMQEARIGPLTLDEEDRLKLGAEWKALSGTELGDDVWVCYFSFLRRHFALPRKALVELTEALLELRAATPPVPEPQLFRLTPCGPTPTPAEEMSVRAVESMAQLAVPEDHWRLLIALENVGIFADVWWDEREAWLTRWNLPIVREYLHAARAMNAYLRSPERRRHVPDGKPGILFNAVSIEWFRRPSVPEGFEEHDWLGLCERAFLDAPSTVGQEGEVFTRVGKHWCRIVWRMEHPLPPAIIATFLE